MPKLNVLNIQGQNVGEIELSDAVFGVEVIDKFFSFKLWLKSREIIVIPFDTFSRTANQCGNSIAVYCFSIRLPQKAKKRVQNNVLDLSMPSRIVYCPSTLLFLF